MRPELGCLPDSLLHRGRLCTRHRHCRAARLGLRRAGRGLERAARRQPVQLLQHGGRRSAADRRRAVAGRCNGCRKLLYAAR